MPSKSGGANPTSQGGEGKVVPATFTTAGRIVKERQHLVRGSRGLSGRRHRHCLQQYTGEKQSPRRHAELNIVCGSDNTTTLRFIDNGVSTGDDNDDKTTAAATTI